MGPWSTRGLSFLYLFDFGDNWEVSITVLEPAEPEAETIYLRNVETHGASPPQYPIWEDESDEGIVSVDDDESRQEVAL